MRVNDLRSFDFGLGETADMLRESVRGFAADRIAPRADEIDRSNTFPRDLWPELGKLGVHGITVPEAFVCPSPSAAKLTPGPPSSGWSATNFLNCSSV